MIRPASFIWENKSVLASNSRVFILGGDGYRGWLKANEIAAMLKKVNSFMPLIDMEKVLPCVSWEKTMGSAPELSPNGHESQDETQSAS